MACSQKIDDGGGDLKSTLNQTFLLTQKNLPGANAPAYFASQRERRRKKGLQHLCRAEWFCMVALILLFQENERQR